MCMHATVWNISIDFGLGWFAAFLDGLPHIHFALFILSPKRRTVMHPINQVVSFEEELCLHLDGKSQSSMGRNRIHLFYFSVFPLKNVDSSVLRGSSSNAMAHIYTYERTYAGWKKGKDWEKVEKIFKIFKWTKVNSKILLSSLTWQVGTELKMARINLNNERQLLHIQLRVRAINKLGNRWKVQVDG